MIHNNKVNSIKFNWFETTFELFASKALLINQTNELLISDVHIGKAEYFQMRGIPLTNNEDENNLKKIYTLIKNVNPKKLIILGDLFHSKSSLTKNLINKVERLCQYNKNKIQLIEGNHDKGCIIKGIQYLSSKKSLNLVFTHEPIKFKDKNVLNICGHYHPKIILKNYNDRLTLRCFALDNEKNILYLPSFGDLTGGFPCKKKFKKWAIVSDDSIIEI